MSTTGNAQSGQPGWQHDESTGWSRAPEPAPGWGQPGPQSQASWTGAPGVASAPISSPWGTPDAPRAPRRRRRGLGLFGRLIVFPLIFAGLSFGVSALIMKDHATIDAQPTATLASIDGTEALVVPYQRQGSAGMWQLANSDMFQIRLAAVGLADGDLLWDVQLTDDLIGAVAVLAADEAMVYVTTDSGLMILDVADGSEVASGADIEGLGDRAVLDAGAYGYDPVDNVIVVIDTLGALLEIPVGSATAAPADAAVAERWAGTLHPDGTLWMSITNGYITTTNQWVGADGFAVTLTEIEAAVKRSRLDVTLPDGTVVAGPELVGAEIVVDGPSAMVAGLPSGLVVVEHKESINGPDTTLSVFSATTGKAVGTIPGAGSVLRVLTDEDGRTILVIGDSGPEATIVVLDQSGIATTAQIGHMNIFGSPS